MTSRQKKAALALAGAMLAAAAAAALQAGNTNPLYKASPYQTNPLYKQ